LLKARGCRERQVGLSPARILLKAIEHEWTSAAVVDTLVA
jgi:hypothetical protein